MIVFLFHFHSGVITMSCTDSNATSSDTSDPPGSPYSHTSVSDDTQQQQKMNNTITKGKTTTINSSPPAANSNAKNLKRQAQQADKCDKKRAKKDDKLNNNKTNVNNVEVKLITPSPPPALAVGQLQQSTNKKSNFAKSTLAAITSMNVFNNKTIKGSTGINTTMSSSPIVIPVPANPISQPPNLAQLSNNNNNNLSNVNKLTTYYKLKKDSNAFALEKLCNMFIAPGVRPLGSKLEEHGFKTINNNQTVAICGNQQQPTKQQPPSTNSNKKTIIEKKTAKIAPVMPVARKTNSTPSQIPIQQLQLQHPQLKISPKKPVSIAPRIIEPKQLLKNGMLQQKNAIATTVINNATKAITMTQQHNLNGQKSTQQQQQRVLLAAIIPTSTMHQQQAQPPPLKMQNGLLHKTTTTTTTTTKLAPLLQFHSQPMLPNLIQLPNLIATGNISKMGSQMGKTQPTITPNLYVNSLNNGLNGQQQHHHHQQQLFMNGAVIKLQPIVSSSSQNLNNSATMTTTNVPFTQANHHQQQQQQAKFTLQHQQQQQVFSAAQQLAAQQMQQLFMSTPVLFNTASIPTVLSSQLASLQHAYQQQQQQQQQQAAGPPTTIPALQPIQSSYFNGLTATNGTTTTNSIQLPSISTLLQHHHPTMAQAQQQFHLQHQQQQHHISNIPALMKTSMTNSLFQTSQGYATLPPSLTITSGFMPIQQNHQQHQKFATSIQSTPTTTYVTNSMAMVKPQPQQQLIYAQATSKAPPPLAPASMHPISITNFPKLFSVSSSSQTSPSSPPPLMVMNQKITLPMASPKVTLTAIPILAQEMKSNVIAVVPPLPSPAKILKIEIDQKMEYYPKLDILDKKCEITIVVDEKPVIDVLVLECAKSPILSQPKTIRFPPVNGKVTMWKPNSKGKGASYVKVSKIGMCNWEKCSKQFDSNSDLLDHMHQHHVNLQVGPFVCSWKECKVNGKESCSKRWLERHVMTHVGSKPFKCIVERCGMRFSNQVRHLKKDLRLFKILMKFLHFQMSLEKHVNGHFNIQDSQNANKRSSDPPQPKKTKKDHKKIKCRRQPWSGNKSFFNN